MQISDYKLGDELFRHVSGGGVFRYLVQCVRTYEDGPQLEVECETCSHGWKCRLLLAQNDYGKIVHVHMLNEDEDEPQRHWHGNEGLHFWPTKGEAREEGLQQIIKRTNDEIRKKEDDLKAAKKYRDELVAAIGVAT